jgi:hypothetical protein
MKEIFAALFLPTFKDSFFFRFFRENSDIQDGYRGYMATTFTKKFKNFFSPSFMYISYDKTSSDFFTAWVT